MRKTQNTGLIVAIVFASSVISGSLVFFGLQLSANGMGANLAAAPKADTKQVAQDAGAQVKPSTQQAAPTDVAVPKPSASEDHIFGKQDARFSLIEYSDFMCPFCKRFHTTAKALVEKYPNDLNWVYRDFPLGSHDPLATDMAVAAECVAKVSGNDAYWKFADELFVDQANTNKGKEYYAALAQKVGADSAKVVSCFEARETEAEVKADLAEGYEIGVSGTPANYVLDTKTGEVFFVGGAASIAKFSSIIDSQLQK